MDRVQARSNAPTPTATVEEDLRAIDASLLELARLCGSPATSIEEHRTERDAQRRRRAFTVIDGGAS